MEKKICSTIDGESNLRDNARIQSAVRVTDVGQRKLSTCKLCSDHCSNSDDASSIGYSSAPSTTYSSSSGGRPDDLERGVEFYDLSELDLILAADSIFREWTPETRWTFKNMIPEMTTVESQSATNLLSVVQSSSPLEYMPDVSGCDKVWPAEHVVEVPEVHIYEEIDDNFSANCRQPVVSNAQRQPPPLPERNFNRKLHYRKPPFSWRQVNV
ncbi:Serine hydroxymethyltransferase [Trichinella spiralis]|uniref:Serine hydroxymethyltransferase n=1 Tax=Trichinella spiralis TaxID=6334 RepID=A0ABR3KS28_TRISP